MNGDIAFKSVEAFLTRLFIQLLAVGGGIAIARELGPSAKGSFTYVLTVVGTVQMLWAGQSSAIVWQYAKRGHDRAAVFRAALRIFSIGSAAAALVLAAAAFVFREQHVLYATAAVVPFALFVQLAGGFFLADSDVRALNVQQFLSAAAPVVLYVPLLLFVHASLVAVLLVWVAAYVGTAAFSWIRLRRHMQVEPGRADTALIRTQLVYGSQMSLNSIVSYLNFRIDVFLVLFMLGQQALGIYSIGIALGELLFNITRPIVTAAMGRIARSDERESAETTAKCMRHSFALVLLCSVAVYVVGPRLVVLVYGQQFAGAGAVLRWLLPGVIAYSAMPVLAAFFSQQLGNPRIPLLFSGVSMTLCALITAATLPRFGIVGGAIATSASYILAFVLALAYFLRRTRISIVRLFVLSGGDLQAYRRVAGRLRASLAGVLHM
jgi:O-antigen/teichoic acid export membrane protein